jgi:hypothetical protein
MELLDLEPRDFRHITEEEYDNLMLATMSPKVHIVRWFDSGALFANSRAAMWPVLPVSDGCTPTVRPMYGRFAWADFFVRSACLAAPCP